MPHIDSYDTFTLHPCYIYVCQFRHLDHALMRSRINEFGWAMAYAKIEGSGVEKVFSIISYHN